MKEFKLKNQDRELVMTKKFKTFHDAADFCDRLNNSWVKSFESGVITYDECKKAVIFFIEGNKSTLCIR